ncbi:uncharacterized protein LOC112566300 [Pomacea canaliculata]|uniref:uncharacterized protein LOC112566300 n=1 Tax=Pomacea canaliculata TaxID=400727 RepID=UPI000D72F384|nr:uncharacterized protein LOC112566300 [Pomacea canaliculata]XP_025098179.1 uncharacterized protein LOC112566300 [Pomacea canaliculata]
MTTRLPGYSPYVHTKHRLTTSLLLSTSTCRVFRYYDGQSSRELRSWLFQCQLGGPPSPDRNQQTRSTSRRMDASSRVENGKREPFENWKMDVQNQIAHIAQTLDASLRHYPHPEVGRRFDYADKVQEAEREKRKYLSDPERATAHAQDFSRTSHARRQF